MRRKLMTVSVSSLALAAAAHGAVVVDSELIRSTAQTPAPSPWTFATIPSPSATDLAQSAVFSAPVGVVQDGNPLTLLQNGQGQSGGDSPGESIFFSGASEDRGRILIDLNASAPLARVTIFSRHEGEGDTPKGVRGPQKLSLYASNDATAPAATDLSQWTLVGSVDQTDLANGGENFTEWRGFYASNFRQDDNSSLGTYRYLLVDVDRPSYASTFLGEIDVVAIPEPAALGALVAGGVMALGRRRR